jgi:hypothetical protein
MAEILGVKPQLDRILELQGSNDSEEAVALKSQILQKALVGYLEVRKASDQNWRELSYSFNIMRREQRKQDLINQCFTLANFAQLSTLYTLEPFLRLNLYFKASAMCTQTGNGIGLLLPVLSIVQQKTAWVGKTEPPEAMKEIIDGGPINTRGLPDYVDKFFDAPAPGSTISRRQSLFELWKSRYGVDASNESNLCSLLDKDRHAYRKTIRSLHTRILLLYSLYSYILDMDNSLLALLRLVHSPAGSQINLQATELNLASLGLSPAAIHAAKLINIKSEVAQLVQLNKSGGDNFTRQRLEVLVLERILTAALEVRAASDQVDAELNYANDVVLAELLARRGRQLQLNYEANFIQAGVFGSVAGLLYLKGYPKAGNEQFVISGGIGTLLSTQALLLMRGGKRPIDTKPNSLADVFDLDQEHRFSPLITAFLNSPSLDSNSGESRKQELEQYWKKHKATTVNVDNNRIREKLAAMPSARFDRIQIVSNRITMLHRLLYEVELFDTELLALLRATDSNNNPPELQNIVADKANLSPHAAEATSLLGLQSLVGYLRTSPAGTYDPILVGDRLFLVRRVFTTALDVRTNIDTLDGEISYESDVLDRMTRARDHTVALLNNANFYQLGILAIIIDGNLGLSGNTRWLRASNMLNIVSGLSVGGLAGAALLAQRGGWRPVPSRLNMLGQTLGMSPPEEYRFSPEVWRFINSVPPTSKNGLTRVEQMRKMWKEEKGIYPNMDKQSTREKMAAYGPHHSELSESIKLIKYRLNMLYDVQGLVGLFDTDLDDLLRSV